VAVLAPLSHYSTLIDPRCDGLRIRKSHPTLAMANRYTSIGISTCRNILRTADLLTCDSLQAYSRHQ
jgi:hypothetical protein